jgi:hypothetical protein
LRLSEAVVVVSHQCSQAETRANCLAIEEFKALKRIKPCTCTGLLQQPFETYHFHHGCRHVRPNTLPRCWAFSCSCSNEYLSCKQTPGITWPWYAQCWHALDLDSWWYLLYSIIY